MHDTKKQGKRYISCTKFPSFSYGREIGVPQYNSKGMNDPNVNGEHCPTLTKDQRDISQTYFLNLQWKQDLHLMHDPNLDNRGWDEHSEQKIKIDFFTKEFPRFPMSAKKEICKMYLIKWIKITFSGKT